ncbi:UNVERIFIED_CONTAM: hypothetical protein Sradi_0495700 [Sesamum radiatum]|uniref:Uncharacterized protein n=1 Tax=Sesamum radiatum TaxID=300843 RepID=A0AAW2VGU2_SESRA
MTTDGEGEPKIEQKSVLVQETIDKPTKMHNAGSWKREATKKDKSTGKKLLSDSEDFGMRVITLAGENKGAVMELTTSHKKTQSKNAKAGYQSNRESGEEGKHNYDDKEAKTTVQSQPMTAFLNSNVQGVNNSILFNATCRFNDPGIHLSLTRKPNND